jgi:drug/metabolite transporter (DMT)-like permease
VTRGAKVWVALWAVYVLWGSTYLAIAIVVETTPPVLGASTRFLAAGAIMALVVVRRGGTMRVTWPQLGSCVLIGALLPGANAVLFYAEQNTQIGIASLIIASIPLWVVVLRLTLRDRVPTAVLVGVGIGFAGVALLAHPGHGATVGGILLCVASSLMWSVGTVAAKRLPMPADAFAATGWEMLAGGALMLPIGLLHVGSASPSWHAVFAWIYLVLFGSVIGYTAYTWLVVHAPLGLVSTYAYVNPIIAIVLGLLFRHEHLTWREGIGAAIVVSAVALVVRREPPTATQLEEGVR